MSSTIGRVFYTNIVAENTIEQDILASLRVKRDYLQYVMDNRTLSFAG